MKSWVLRCGAGLIAFAQSVTAGVSTTCPAGGVTLNVQSSKLPGTLTSIDLASLTSGPIAGTELFSLFLQPAETFHSLVSLSVEIKAVPTDPQYTCPDAYPMVGVPQGCWLQRQTTDQITLVGTQAQLNGLSANAARGPKLYTASQLARMPKRREGDISSQNSPFQALVSRLGGVPAGQIHLRFSVNCEGKELASATLKGDYRPVERPTLVMPGGAVRDGFQPVATATPSLVWNGSLTGVTLRNGASYRVTVWEIPEGQSLEDALARQSMRATLTSSSMLSWPPTWPILEQGKRYAWRVDALKRGLTDDWLASDVFGFVLQNLTPITPLPTEVKGTAEQSELLRLLMSLAGPQRSKVEAALRSNLPDPLSMQLDGKTVDLERLREMVRDLQQQKISVEGVETTR